jgi:4-amino-4-deoxy-L-arabinose transferase-like glycosyltransferase
VLLYFKNDIIPKFIHFAFGLLTAAMIYRYLKRRINKEYAALGSLFFLTIPIIVRLSGTVYVDLGLICFLFASLLFLFHWIESGFKINYLVISAVFCGLGLGTKYNALIGLFLVSLFAAFIYARYNSRQRFYVVKSIGLGAFFVFIALIVFSPWMIRNVAWTGNPVYPLYNRIFNPEESISKEIDPNNMIQVRSNMSHINVRHQIYNESWLEIVLIPLRVFFQGKDYDPKYFDGRINPFLLILPVFAFFGMRSGNRQEGTEKWVLLFFSVFFLLYTCAQRGIRIRYFGPILPPLVILSMYGLHNIQAVFLSRMAWPSGKILKNGVIFGIIFIMLSFNAVYMLNRFKYVQPLAYITGKLSRDEYIQTYRPEYATLQYANSNLGEDAQIFAPHFSRRGYYSDIKIEFSTTMLQEIASEADSGRDVVQKFQDKGFSHLLINFPVFNYLVKKYPIHDKKVLKDFFETYTVKEFSKEGFGLLRIMALP